MTTQPNTEPLKVGEECREAFEQWILGLWDAENLRTDGVGTYVCVHTFLKWQAWQAAWNRRTEPSPAEVSSEGLTDEEIVSCLVEAKCLEEKKVQLWYEVGPYDITRPSSYAINFTRAIERALNQRLAVDEGEAVGEVDDTTGGACVNWYGRIPENGAKLYTHPVSDDQQAKDAALRQARDCINTLWVSHHANRCDAAIEAIDAALSTTKQEGA